MIAYIKGVLDYVTENKLIIESGGIGYLLQVTASTASRLPPVGQEVKLFTSFSVKEDAISLYGFTTMEELNIYNLLVTVSGVGPRAAMNILSVLSPAQIMISILSDDVQSLSKAPGVGKKTAQRLCLELKDKMRSQNSFTEESSNPQQSLKAQGGERQDAMDALTALGYSRSEAMSSVMEVALEDMKADQIIKLALKKLVSI